MGRPILKIELETSDKIVYWLGVSACLALVILPFYFFPYLPEEVPRHFGSDGTPDAWGSRNYVFMMPFIGLILFVGMFFLSKVPHIYNYTVEITEENAAVQYKRSSRMIRVLNTAIILTFLYIEITTLRTALGKSEGLGGWFLPVFMMVMFGIPVAYLIFSPKKSS